MGKRSDFQRMKRDFYPTPFEAVLPLIPHLPENVTFDEPCCGNGRLIGHLEHFGMECQYRGDIELGNDALNTTMCSGEMFITNPPWDRSILHPLIDLLSSIAPTWLLFDADWAHTKQSRLFMPRLHKIVSVGRLKMTGKDNCAWYLFAGERVGKGIEFIGR